MIFNPLFFYLFFGDILANLERFRAGRQAGGISAGGGKVLPSAAAAAPWVQQRCGRNGWMTESGVNTPPAVIGGG